MFQGVCIVKAEELGVFNAMPFLFWVKNGDGKYLWGNTTISKFAGEDVVGKTDHDLVWKDNADALIAEDREVLRTGKTAFVHEYVGESSKGKSTLNVCKWVGEYEGERRIFGISFVIDET